MANGIPEETKRRFWIQSSQQRVGLQFSHSHHIYSSTCTTISYSSLKTEHGS